MPDRPIYADPTFEAVHRRHEAEKRRQARRCDWGVIVRKRRRIQRLVREVLGQVA